MEFIMILRIRKPVRTTRSVTDLRPHPKQAKYFRDMPLSQLADLADNIEKNGLESPIEISPKGRIISGHQRYRAVVRLGWDEVPVIIRYDLAAQGKKAIEQRLVEANLHRRHLNDLEMARMCKAIRARRTASGAERTPSLSF
jgi:ParB family chromosome partitioning protein